MGLVDVDGFGLSEIKLQNDIVVKDKNKFVENSFDKSITEEVSPLIKMKVINKYYNLGKILKDLGYNLNTSNMYCPFHPDSATGKESAKYYPDSDLLYCFSENKLYSAYHAIKLIYGLDVNQVFNDLWSKMSISERHFFMDSEGTKNTINTKEGMVWEKYKEPVLGKFKKSEVNFTQYKNALYKILELANKED